MTLDQVTAQVRLRLVKPSDAALVRKVFVSSRPHLALIPLPPAQLDDLIDQQVHAQQVGYEAGFEGTLDQVIERDGVAAGRLFTSWTPAQVRVLDLAVLPEARGRGVATAALNVLVARSGSRPILLQVSAGSPAQRLYERLGFTVTAADVMGLAMERRAT